MRRNFSGRDPSRRWCPGGSGLTGYDRGMSVRPDNERHPPVDERLVMPGSRYEVIDGRVVYVSPSDEPHATQHSKLQALLEVSAADGYAVACDMLTRTSEVDDMAPDASVYPAAPDPQTGGRRLEQLAFEVVATERIGAAGQKAARLHARGVRRVFAIDVHRRRVLRWEPERDGWRILAQDERIEDPALAVPLAVADLLSAARVDDAVARALLARGNPVIGAALAAERVAGKASALLALLEARGFAVSDFQRATVRGGDDAALDRWLVRVLTAADIDEVFAG
jgi:hypothetical protein